MESSVQPTREYEDMNQWISEWYHQHYFYMKKLACRITQDPCIADEHVAIGRSYLLYENCLQLRQAISQLSARDQTLLHSKYILELSDKEIAAKLTTSEKNIRSYLTRARRRAYKQYTRHPPDLHAQANCSRLNISK
ncbi:RNA polymerase sigma factor [Paenibacillus popilliae]|uniref:DNA-directed RNA polymerase n=1 Tax=Paenibacillus popilliae ATCC 14706 TaxID=1212764 RepID=M9LGQ3_PAEPP|nr:sigma-70 region 4 domain-containing protein [Paenibacillus popilliae]GAC41785.1 DNA-directed RNA polymerase [Paenibacillus popilliae ATCC 14706]